MDGALFAGVAQGTYSLLHNRSREVRPLMTAVLSDVALGVLVTRLVPGAGGLLLLPLARAGKEALQANGAATELLRMTATLMLAKTSLMIFQGKTLVPAATLGASAYMLDKVVDKLGTVVKLKSKL